MRYVFLSVFCLLLACQSKEKIAYVEVLDPALNTIISSETTIEVLADEFEWSEGPLWVEQENMLLFSDVPKNVIYKWSEAKGLETYLTPSGYTTQEEGNIGEGSNGLLLNAKGELVLCQHGDRRLAVMQASFQRPQAIFTTLVDRVEGKRFNSPNDAAYNSKGVLFFTDPPYGLASQDTDSLKELAFNGVYSLNSTGTVQLLIDSLTRPNGIITINDSTLLVANSDNMKANWYRYTLKRDSLVTGEVFYDATINAQSEKGLPDGLKISSKGIIYATGPGGVWIFDLQGKVLGKIRTTVAASNCALDQHEKYLYITASNYLLRIALK